MGVVVLSTLNTELTTDPRGFGFSSLISAGDYQGMTAQLTSVPRNVSLGTVSTVSVATINAAQLQALIIGTEYLSLAPTTATLWNSILTASVNGIAISNAAIRAQVLAVWSAGTSSRANLAAAQNRQASRIEVLFGEGTPLAWEHCFKALHP